MKTFNIVKEEKMCLNIHMYSKDSVIRTNQNKLSRQRLVFSKRSLSREAVIKALKPHFYFQNFLVSGLIHPK